jgi:regulator of RNase E activity RraA
MASFVFSIHLLNAQVNVPIKLQSEDQEAWIHPNDYIIGDLNGVVCIPQALAGKVISLARSQVEADDLVGKDIDNGSSFVEASQLHRAHVLRAD